MSINRKFFYDQVRGSLFGGKLSPSSSGQMLPCIPAFDASDVATVNAVFRGNQAVNSRISDDFSGLLFREFRVSSFAVSVSAFGNHIFAILFHCSTFQVVKATARWIVANKMTNLFAGNIFTGFEGVDHSVSQNELTGIVKPSISVVIQPACPKPATITLFNTFIQSLTQWAVQFSLLVARICTVFAVFVCRFFKYNAATGTNNCDRISFSEIFTSVRTKLSCRCSKWKELLITLFADFRNGHSLVHGSIIA